jgi:hypothetical protein
LFLFSSTVRDGFRFCMGRDFFCFFLKVVSDLFGSFLCFDDFYLFLISVFLFSFVNVFSMKQVK